MCSDNIRKLLRSFWSRLLRSCPLSLLVLALIPLVSVHAQELGPPSPGLPPGPPLPEAPGVALPYLPRSLLAGRLYAEAGVRFRNLQTVNAKSLQLTGQGIEDLNGDTFVTLPETSYGFTNKVWTPNFEFGYQASNFGDVFATFSWFGVSNSHGFQVVSSGNQVVTSTIQYHITLDSYETRAGVRSWYPLWGMGRIGVTLGGFTSVIPYRVDVTRANTQGAQFPSGTGSHESTWVQWGGTGGVEMELDLSRILFKFAADYSYGSELIYNELLGTETRLAPMGFSAVFAGGLRF